MTIFLKSFILIALASFLSGCRPYNEDALPEQFETKEAIINLKGEFLTKPIYDSISRRTENGHFFSVQKFPPSEEDGYNGYNIVFDLTGRIIKKKSSNFGYDWHDTYTYDNHDMRWLNIHPKNEVPNLVPTLSNGKYGFKNQQGLWVIQPQWDYVQGFEHNVCFVWNYDHPYSRWGLINAKGQYLLKPTCLSIRRFKPDIQLRICKLPSTYKYP